VFLPLWPIYLLDIGGSAVTILLSLLSFRGAAKLIEKDRENIFWLYLLWLTFSLTVFAFSRGIGHILQYIFVFTGRGRVWEVLNPVSGSLNTLSFVFTATVSLFFLELQAIYNKISADKERMAALNRELSSLNTELDNIISERALNLMALGVADRLRNPATVIGAIVARLMKSPDTPAAVKERLAEIGQSSERLDNIVKEYEEILRSKEAYFCFEDLNGIIREILLVTEGQFREKGLKLDLALSETPIGFYAIKHLIRIAILHIIKNAVEASYPGGAVTIATRRDNKRVFVSVKDEGRGMREEDIPKIFELFYSTKGRMGTGLAIVKQIVEEHGGEIKVESAPGKGSLFTLYFPSGWHQFEACIPESAKKGLTTSG